MHFVISPAKSLDYDTPAPECAPTQPAFLDAAETLVGVMRDFSPAALGELMHISDKLAALNVARFAEWSRPFNRKNAKPCLFAFNGDVYDGLDAATLDAEGIAYAQQHLRILSGLYGVLRPLDLIQAYRLERHAAGHRGRAHQLTSGATAPPRRSTPWEVRRQGAGEPRRRSTRHPAGPSQGADHHSRVRGRKGGRYKIISFHAARARGLMVATRSTTVSVDALKLLDTDGYTFAADA
ncbi:MAG: peroxide stress protein YaaA [Rhodocyclaceae bacterium]